MSLASPPSESAQNKERRKQYDPRDYDGSEQEEDEA
jgi:hypothetical protein